MARKVSKIDKVVLTDVGPRGARWFRALDLLELAVASLLPPAGLEAARFQSVHEGVVALSSDIPFGRLYRQRLRRVFAALKRDGILEQRGRGHARRFALTPMGLVALAANLRFPSVDPTTTGADFELKREIVALWQNIAASEASNKDGSFARFLAEADRVAQGDHSRLRRGALDVIFDPVELIAIEASFVETLRDRTASQPIAPRGRSVAAELAASAVRRAAAVARYNQYLSYLEELCALYVARKKPERSPVPRRR